MASTARTVVNLAAYLNDSLNDTSVVLLPDQPDHKAECMTWGAQRNLHPQVVLRPQCMDQVQEIVKVLCKTTVDFVVRNGGVGSASSSDVVITLSKMKSVTFDEEAEIVSVQAGALWEDVEKYMKQNAKGWAVVSSRTPFVGVAGIALVGGLSWLSHEFGLIADPQNLLDVQVVLGDGQAVWGSDHPDLLWAISGGRTACGVITALKFRAQRYDTDNVFAGRIMYPMEKLKEVSRKVAAHVARNHDLRVAFHAFVLNPASPLFSSPPGIGLMIFDGNGEEHGRSDAGFQRASDINGVTEQTATMSLYQSNDGTSMAKPLAGKYASHDACGLIDEVDEGLLVRAVKWFDTVLETDERLHVGSYCLIEFTQSAAFNSRKTASDTAYPHLGHKHCLQLGIGYAPEHADLKPVAQRLLNEAFETIPKVPLGKGSFTPTFVEPSVIDVRLMYGPKYDRRKQISRRYDPEQRLRSIFRPGQNWADADVTKA